MLPTWLKRRSWIREREILKPLRPWQLAFKPGLSFIDDFIWNETSKFPNGIYTNYRLYSLLSDKLLNVIKILTWRALVNQWMNPFSEAQCRPVPLGVSSLAPALPVFRDINPSSVRRWPPQNNVILFDFNKFSSQAVCFFFFFTFVRVRNAKGLTLWRLVLLKWRSCGLSHRVEL